MRMIRRLAIGAAVLALALSACTQSGGGSSSTPKPTIKIGSVGFNEAQVVAEMYAQVLEDAGYTVDRQLGIGTRDVTLPALESGKIDLQPEYLGSGTAHYDNTKATADPAATAQALQAILKTKGGGITVLAYSPGQDFDAFAVTKDTATQLKLTRMSDLAAVQDKLKWGLPPECDKNPICKGALVDTYGITWPPANLKPLAACDVPIAEALRGGAINIAELCSTQAAIAQYGFVILEDDKGTNPAQNLAPLVRDDFLAKLSASDRADFMKRLEGVSNKLTTEALQKINIALNVDNKDVKDAAKEFLTTNGLLAK
jgi:osmoprotectant transport system substrate-binding protein